MFNVSQEELYFKQVISYSEIWVILKHRNITVLCNRINIRFYDLEVFINSRTIGF